MIPSLKRTIGPKHGWLEAPTKKHQKNSKTLQVDLAGLFPLPQDPWFPFLPLLSPTLQPARHVSYRNLIEVQVGGNRESRVASWFLTSENVSPTWLLALFCTEYTPDD